MREILGKAKTVRELLKGVTDVIEATFPEGPDRIEETLASSSRDRARERRLERPSGCHGGAASDDR